MDERDPILSVKCSEPEGEVVRVVRPAPISLESLRHYYEKLKKFDVVFNDHVQNTPEGFASIFISWDEDGNITPNGLLWTVDDVGILYITNLRPGYSAQAHFSFWDRRIRGREELIRKMIAYCFDRYEFHRIETRVALYATGIMGAVERIGFKKEGRARESVRFNGDWFDVNLYSILEGEV